MFFLSTHVNETGKLNQHYFPHIYLDRKSWFNWFFILKFSSYIFHILHLYVVVCNTLWISKISYSTWCVYNIFEKLSIQWTKNKPNHFLLRRMIQTQIFGIYLKWKKSILIYISHSVSDRITHTPGELSCFCSHTMVW